MKLCRTEWFEGKKTYELELTPQLVGEFNLWLLERVEGVFNPITEEEIIEVYKTGELENNQTITLKNSIYSSTMDEIIRDYFTDELWNGYCEYSDEDIIDCEDYITD